MLTLKPHIIRGLALEEDDLRPFRVGTSAMAGAGGAGAPAGASRTQPRPQPRPGAGRRLPGQPADVQRPIAPPPAPPDR